MVGTFLLTCSDMIFKIIGSFFQILYSFETLKHDL
jgi:hypothetical protein